MCCENYGSLLRDYKYSKLNFMENREQQILSEIKEMMASIRSQLEMLDMKMAELQHEVDPEEFEADAMDMELDGVMPVGGFAGLVEIGEGAEEVEAVAMAEDGLEAEGGEEAVAEAGLEAKGGEEAVAMDFVESGAEGPAEEEEEGAAGEPEAGAAKENVKAVAEAIVEPDEESEEEGAAGEPEGGVDEMQVEDSKLEIEELDIEDLPEIEDILDFEDIEDLELKMADMPEPVTVPVEVAVTAPVTVPVAEPEPTSKQAEVITIAEKAEENAKPTLNDVKAPVYAWKRDMTGSPVRDVRSAISLNDRVIFINMLFSEDARLFVNTLMHINTLTTLDQAVEYLTRNFPQWDMNSEVVYHFMMAVRRKVQ